MELFFDLFFVGGERGRSRALFSADEHLGILAIVQHKVSGAGPGGIRSYITGLSDSGQSWDILAFEECGNLQNLQFLANGYFSSPPQT